MNIELLHTLTNPNSDGTSIVDYYAWAVANDGNYCIIGAYQEDNSSELNGGRAYIYNVTTGLLVTTINNPNSYSTETDDYFGYSVAIYGDYCAIGAYREDSSGGTNSGVVYIFNILTGDLIHTLGDPNTYSSTYPSPAGDAFGEIIDMYGDYCVIGTINEDDGGSASGLAYVFDVNSGNMIRALRNPNIYGTAANDNFSNSIAIYGDYCAIGARGEDSALGTSTGNVYIFNVVTGDLVSTLSNPNVYGTPAGDNFGYDVAMYGDYCVVGAQGEDNVYGTTCGAAYIFNYITGQLLHTLTDPLTYLFENADRFGWAVAIYGDYCAIGAYNEGPTKWGAAGALHIYNIQTGELEYSINGKESSTFGRSVSMRGDYLIVGAPFEFLYEGSVDRPGRAYIYKIGSTTLIKTLQIFASINGTIKELTGYINDNGTIKAITGYGNIP